MKLSIIIPVYNEKTVVSVLIEKVARADTAPFEKEIIIVDDGSTDGSAEALKNFCRRPGIRVLTHERNSGKAAAVRSALAVAAGDVVMIQDADLEYSPDDYHQLLAPFTDPKTIVVYGSRFLSLLWPENMKAANWLANKLFTCLVNVLYGARITDEGTAYKLFRKDVITSLHLTGSGFEFDPETTAKVLKQGIRIYEVPISYTARNKKEGKKPGPRDGLRTLWTILKCRFVP